MQAEAKSYHWQNLSASLCTHLFDVLSLPGLGLNAQGHVSDDNKGELRGSFKNFERSNFKRKRNAGEINLNIYFS